MSQFYGKALKWMLIINSILKFNLFYAAFKKWMETQYECFKTLREYIRVR